MSDAESAPQPLLARILARVFRLFAKVEPAEAITAAVMTLTVFLLLTAYYLLKTAREPLILLHGGAEVKSYASAGQALLLVGVVRAYSAVARRVGRMKLLASVYFFFVANLVIFAALARAHVDIGVVFYLWVGIFSVTAIAQFWALAADIYTPEQGKRLFAILGIGSSAGAVAGSRIAKALVALGPQGLMIAAAGILVVCVGILAWVERRAGAPGQKTSDTKHDEPLVHENTFGVLIKDKYLLLIAAITLILNWVNSTGEYLVDRTLLASSGAQGDDAEKFVGAFKADYFAWVNLVGMLLQLFAVSRIIAKIGVRNALFFLPGVAFIGYSLMLFSPVLSVIRVAKIAENSLDYSLENTARQALYLVTSHVEKYVGKTVVDTLVVRLGDVFSAAVVWVGTRMMWPTAAFAGFNLGLIALWLGIVYVIGKEHARRSDETEEQLAAEPVAA